MIRRAAVVALLASLLSIAAPRRARAELAIVAPSCADLDLPEVERVLALEIAEVAAEWSERATPVVLLGCTPDARVRIEITDPVTDKSVARTVSMPEADRERVIGIAIGQLFLTSWLELLIDGDTHEERPGAEAAELRARAAVERSEAGEAGRSQRTIASAEHRSGVLAEVAIEGGARVRTGGEQLATVASALRAALEIDGALLVGVRVSTEWGRATRTRGSIDAITASAGIGAGWRTPRLDLFFVDVTGWLSATWIDLSGRPSSPDVEAGTTQAVAGEALLEVAPSIAAGPVIVALPIALGGIAFAPDGVVSGEPPVVVGGPFLAASLRVTVVPSLW